ERLNLAVDQELIAQDTVQVEEIEEQLPGIRIKHFVGEQHGNIELAAGQAEAGSFVAGIKVVEQQVLAHQPFVDILRGKVDAVVVVEESAQGLANVAMGGGELRIREAGQHIGIVVVVELPRTVEETGEAVAFGRGVRVMKVRSDGVVAKAS